MNVTNFHRALLFANIPVALFAIMMAWAALFGIGVWDWVRGFWVLSPILLATLLAWSTHLLDQGRRRLAIAIAATPIIGLGVVAAFILAVAA